MREPSDFMFICELETRALRGVGYVRPSRAMWNTALVVVAIAIYLVRDWWLLAVAPALGAGILGLCGVLRSKVPNGVVAFHRDLDHCRGRYAPESAVGPVGPWWAPASFGAFGLVPLVGGLLQLWLIGVLYRRTRARGAEMAWLGEEDVRYLLAAYVLYPDGDEASQAIWYPRNPAAMRRARLGWGMRPFVVVAAAGIIGSWVAAYFIFVHPPVWLGVTAFLVACVNTASLVDLVPRVHAALLAEPMARLLARQRLLLPPGESDWESAAQLVAASTHVGPEGKLADHLFVGWIVERGWMPETPYETFGNPDDDAKRIRRPFLLHKAALDGHCHITGPTGTYKTSLGLAGLTVQLIRGAAVPHLTEAGDARVGLDGDRVLAANPTLPMLVLDLKGDMFFFNTVRSECARNGRVFRYFTLDPDLDTHYFNIFTNLNVDHRPPLEFIELVMKMLGLDHGSGYGRSYYTRESRDRGIRTLHEARVKPRSWQEFYDLLKNETDDSRQKDVAELLSTVYALTCHPALGPSPDPEKTIHMPRVMADGECVYFWLPARVSAMSTRDIGKMALYAFMTAASDHNRNVGERRSVAVVDEVQVISSLEMATVFQQASGARMSLVLANQSRGDLDTSDVRELSRTVNVNTRFKQAFGIVDLDEVREWCAMSGQQMSYIPGSSTSNQSGTHTDPWGQTSSAQSTTHVLQHQPVVHDRLHANIINAVNNEPGVSLVRLATDRGVTPLKGITTRVRTPWVVSAAEYAARARRPWPAREEPPPPREPRPSPRSPRPTPRPEPAATPRRYDAVDELFRRLRPGAGGTDGKIEREGES